MTDERLNKIKEMLDECSSISPDDGYELIEEIERLRDEVYRLHAVCFGLNET